MAWLQAHASDGRVAGTGLTMTPETSSLYGIADVRGYDVVRATRVRTFWSAAFVTSGP